MMFALFIAITTLKHLETFDSAVYMLYEYSKFRQCAVECFLFRGQLATFGLFIRDYAVFVQTTNALVAFVTDNNYKSVKMHLALPKKLNIMNAAFCLMHTYNLPCNSIYNQLLFDGVALMLA